MASPARSSVHPQAATPASARRTKTAAKTAAKAPARRAAPRAPAKAAQAAKPVLAVTPPATMPPLPAAGSSGSMAPVKARTKPLKADKPTKARARLVRDSFTMPDQDFKLIATLKSRALDAKRPAKKSELLRAGLHVLEGLGAAALVAALNRLMPLKPGRPKKAR